MPELAGVVLRGAGSEVQGLDSAAARPGRLFGQLFDDEGTMSDKGRRLLHGERAADTYCEVASAQGEWMSPYAEKATCSLSV